MKYATPFLTGLLLGALAMVVFADTPGDFLGAPASQATFQKNLIPITDSTYTLGTTSKTWLNVYTDEICLAGSCQTSWSAGSGEQSDWQQSGGYLVPTTTIGISISAPSVFTYASATALTVPTLWGTYASTTGISGTNSFFTTASSSSLYAKAVNFGSSILSLVTDTITGLGIWDLGGATSFEIPNGTGPTVDATGEIALDTTYGQLKYFDGGTAHVLTGTTTRSFSIASTTSGTGGHFSIATTTFLLQNNPEPITLIGWYCQATTTGSVSVRFGDGTNWTNSSSCSTGGTTYASSNNTFTAFENFQVQIGSSASSPNRVTITAFTSKTAQ